MKMGLYPKLAWDGVRKNKRLYVPYLLTGAVMVMMYYIMCFLTNMDRLNQMRGGWFLQYILPLGSWVVAFFAVLFLFYSNSFLLRQRSRELGLYNILGMDKFHLGHIMVWETLFSWLIALIGGLILGIATSKLAECGMINLLREEVDFTLRLDFPAIGKTVAMFGGIYFLLLLNALAKVRHSNVIALLHSTSAGEKPPKANWLFALVGVVVLAAAYFIAVTVENPIYLIFYFFAAVLMVIAATYLLFIAGSVVLCRILQKNKRYYYKANHFVSVSTMAYRMKRNGAGLASICILLTMVLVMLSSTVSLYAGAEDSLNKQYPFDLSLTLPIYTEEQWTEETFAQLQDKVRERVPDRDGEMTYAYAEASGLFTQAGISTDPLIEENLTMTQLGEIGSFQIMPLELYNRLMGTSETLGPGECLLCLRRWVHNGDTFSIGDQPLRVKKVVDDFYKADDPIVGGLPYAMVFVQDMDQVVEPLKGLKDKNGEPYLYMYWTYGVNVPGGDEPQITAYERLHNEIGEIAFRSPEDSLLYSLDCRAYGSREFYGLYGGLFFIGILLSVVFLFAAVLIIYYKQISEGYEDQKRFEIMRKVGMTKADIRRTIDSQVLTVFSSPLLAAGLHLAFAFPAIWRMMQLFNFQNLTLMILVTVGCYACFGLCYALVYKLTANVYYRIVSGALERG